MTRLIWKALKAILNVNAVLYGNGSSRELCRDLAGEYKGKEGA